MANFAVRTYADQIALVATIDPRTHFVKAIAGGVDHKRVQRAIQAHRQPGSAFKPFVYYTAFASANIRLTQLCTTPL